MGILDKLFGKNKKGASEQAVVIEFRYGTTDLTNLFALEDRLRAAIDSEKIGEYDGHEIAIDASHGFFYMYGPDAEKIFELVRPICESTPFMKGAKASIRYGPPGAPQKEIVL